MSITAAALYRSVYERNYMMSIMIKSRNIKDNYITKWRVNAGCIEVLTWSYVEVECIWLCVFDCGLCYMLLLGLSVHAC